MPKKPIGIRKMSIDAFDKADDGTVRMYVSTNVPYDSNTHGNKANKLCVEMQRRMNTHYPPVVVVEVSGGSADTTLCLPGCGRPECYIIDWDNIKEGDEPPEFPRRVWKRLPEATRTDLEKYRAANAAPTE